MTVSLWQQSGPLRGVRADVAVVGAGIAGLSAAIVFERAGLSCVVLERAAPAAGASGRNAGYLMRGGPENYAVARERLGPDTARELWRWTEDNLADLLALGLAETSGFERRASCLLALDDEEADQLDRAHDLLRDDGFESALIRPGDADDTVWSRATPKLGLLNPRDAVCNPVELIGLLCSKLERSELFTGADVLHVESGDPHTVHTSLGSLRAGRVFIATNAWARRLDDRLAALVRPNRGQILAARAPGVRLDHAYYATHGSEYFRQLDAEHVILGGSRLHDEQGERTDIDAVSRAIQDRLEDHLRRLLTDEYEVIARWAGIMGFTADEIPVAGPLDEGVWFCGGFTGHGMSTGHRTATAAARAMLGEADLPSWFSIHRFNRLD